MRVYKKMGSMPRVSFHRVLVRELSAPFMWRDGTMRIREDVRKDVAVLTVTGTLMSGPEVAPFHDHVKQLVERGINRIVVDLSKPAWCGSAMLGVLVASLSTVRNAGGDLRLAGIRERIRSLFVVTQLAEVFQTADTVDRAVASFETQPPEKA